MIYHLTAQQFLNRLGKSLTCPVRITNAQGSVIAATDPGAVGELLPQARQAALQQTALQEDHWACAPIYDGGELAGVAAVEGPAAEARALAQTVRVAMEALADEQRSLTQGRFGGELARALLSGSVGSLPQIRRVTEQYNYVDDQARLPILIQLGMHPQCRRLQQALFSQYEKLELFHSQDILLELDRDRVLLFKCMPDISVSCRFVAAQVAEKLDRFFGDLAGEPQTILYFYGPIQLHFADYASVYRCICWMEQHLRAAPEHVNRFSSYLPEFLLQNIPEENLRPVFGASIYRIEQLWDLQVFGETLGALISTDMKLEAAAQKLYVHKNTVVFRLNKIKEVLGLDPINRIRDANYLIMLYHYWKHYDL